MTRFRTPVLETFSFQPPVKDFLTTPPVAPLPGDRYIVAAPGVGIWSGHEQEIAWWYGMAWQYDVPAVGWVANRTAGNTLYKYDGAAWLPISGSDPTKTDKATLTAKGSIYAASAPGVPADLPVGSDGLILTADSAMPLGLRWGTGTGLDIALTHDFTGFCTHLVHFVGVIPPLGDVYEDTEELVFDSNGNIVTA